MNAIGPMSLTQAIIDYEQGELNDCEVIELFQNLVDTGLCWQLQGHYGRTAIALMKAGWINPPQAAQYRVKTLEDGVR